MFHTLPIEIRNIITDYFISLPKVNIFGLKAFFEKNSQAIGNMTKSNKILNISVADKIINHVMQELGIVLHDNIEPWKPFKNSEDFLLNLCKFVETTSNQLDKENLLNTSNEQIKSNPIFLHLNYLYSSANLNDNHPDQLMNLYNAIQFGSVSSYFAFLSLENADKSIYYNEVLERSRNYLKTNYDLKLNPQEEKCFYKAFGYNLPLGIKLYKKLNEQPEFVNNNEKAFFNEFIARLTLWFYHNRQAPLTIIQEATELLVLQPHQSHLKQDDYPTKEIYQCYQTMEIMKSHFMLCRHNKNEFDSNVPHQNPLQFFKGLNSLIKTIQSQIKTIPESKTYYYPVSIRQMDNTYKLSSNFLPFKLKSESDPTSENNKNANTTQSQSAFFLNKKRSLPSSDQDECSSSKKPKYN